MVSTWTKSAIQRASVGLRRVTSRIVIKGLVVPSIFLQSSFVSNLDPILTPPPNNANLEAYLTHITYLPYFFNWLLFLLLLVLGRLLFKGGVYFVGKPADSNDGWNKYMRTLQLDLIDTGSSMCSVSVLLLAMETSLRTRAALEIAQWASAALLVRVFVHHAY